jgi:predicted nucleotidyltransferase
MTQRIVREVDPQRILLFGSWARGDANQQSDVDLLVIEREPFGPNRSRRQEAARIWRCLSEFRVPKDILVYSVSEIDRWKDSSYHVVGKALKEGKVLYESDRCAP